ncbi:hypothetical protein [Amycolatopsis xylanica]|nr:hypothetical protein [Amycolatopsis xylanica]
MKNYSKARRLVPALLLAMIASLFGAVAPAAQAEPNGSYMECSMHGWVRSVNDPGDCYDGVISVKSTRDNSIYYKLDVFKARWNYGPSTTWESLYKGCTSHWICSAVATTVLGKFIKPLKLLWAFLKRQ